MDVEEQNPQNMKQSFGDKSPMRPSQPRDALIPTAKV